MIKRKHFLYLYFRHKELAKSSDQNKLFLGIDSDYLDPILLFWQSIIAVTLDFWSDRTGSFIIDMFDEFSYLKGRTSDTKRNKLAWWYISLDQFQVRTQDTLRY